MILMKVITLFVLSDTLSHNRTLLQPHQRITRSQNILLRILLHTTITKKLQVLFLLSPYDPLVELIGIAPMSYKIPFQVIKQIPYIYLYRTSFRGPIHRSFVSLNNRGFSFSTAIIITIPFTETPVRSSYA